MKAKGLKYIEFGKLILKHGQLISLRGRRRPMYMLKSEVFPSFVLILMGFIDCLTTVIGVIYAGAVELNPFLAGIVSTNIPAFLAIKILATFCIGFTYILSKRMLNRTVDKSTKSFKYSHSLIKTAYAGLVVFLMVVIANNLLILLA